MYAKRWMAATLAGAMALTLTACGGNADSTSTAESGNLGDDVKKISVILKTSSAEYWQYIQAGAKAYDEEHDDVEVSIKGPTSETAFEEQMAMVETDISTADFDAYVIAPLQPDTVKTMIAGETRPVVALDSNIPDAPEVKTFVGTGNEAAAKQGMEAAVEAAKAAGWTEIKAIEICGVQGEPTNEARKAGFMAGIEENGGDFLEEETQYANATADLAVNCMEAIMQTHPEGIAIICANNDDMAIAAARTAASNPAYENTIFLGFDGVKSACESILNGELDMAAAQDPYNMAYQAVDAAVRLIDGETLPEFIDSGSAVVTKDNAQERLNTLNGYLS
ncbi:ribose ABC transporter substrate-binding protein [Butyricicoccus pullicaecorum]|uniref:Ribose ABC transporter substrate-binding protein n=1 Tax=Butyricicoccus pullicaecorum TaxID=501571 RepID=A0A1Y4L523_9FIRM|nr:sugar ABC transporter substrate-binding protein [Butyricicoccus pullicaecorum]OUP51873.1 ribose ABC transporter substrate-binding protein [Butyricicoccus pullicaecorum]